ncbi:hypothetical protein GWK47_012483 [Chionoecetes opilio]|uniref:Uncharacterized protein n=1 Tax=Chionoecetes opilio TaxID=41210 RepID=A0A8J4XWU0_CHIOP|nr:hypothetical protein GWK47_012483 [Chionoecetes opilio]
MATSRPSTVSQAIDGGISAQVNRTEEEGGSPKASSAAGRGEVHLEGTSEEKAEEGPGGQEARGRKSPNVVAWARVGQHPLPRRSTPGSHPRLPQTQKEAPVRGKQAMGTCDASVSENGTQKLSGPPILAMKEFTEDIQADNPGGTGGEGGKAQETPDQP